MGFRDALAAVAMLCLGFTIAEEPATAQEFPSRPITVVVGSGPGGMDTFARLIAPSINEQLGQPLVIEHKPGANGVIAVQAVTSAPPDGHTLLFASASTLTINPFVLKAVPYDTLRDFEPVARLVSVPIVWVANPARNFGTLSDMVAYARANPGKLSMGHPGNGSLGHLLEEALKRHNGIDVLLVPFKSAVQANTDAMAGFVDISVDNVGTLLGAIRENKLTALAVTAKSRIAALPQVPSWLEDRIGPFESNGWFVLMAPKGTPRAVVDRLNAAINKAIASPFYRERIDALGADATPLSPAELRDMIAGELKKHETLVRDAGIVPQ